MNRPALAAFLFLAACGTPQQQCIARNTRDLRVVDRLILETRANLNRGYALEDVTVYAPQWVRCRPRPTAENPDPAPEMCWDDVPETITRPRAIDLGAEASKLEGLVAKRRQLAIAAESVVAQCKVLHPE